METEELRLRLSAAENTMRKLYRKNTMLQEEVQRGRLSSPLDGASASGAESSVRGSSGAGASGRLSGLDAVSEEEAVSADGVMSGADEQAFYMLQQKETALQAMRDYTSQLQERLESVSALQKEEDASQATKDNTVRMEAANQEYRDRYLRARQDYRQLLRSRVGSLKKSSASSQVREQAVLMGQLDAALQEEAELHRKESQRLNEELYLQEKRACDWHVERRLLEDKVSHMEAQIKERDDLDGEIDAKMAALFGRLKQLEDANLQLEQTNEELQA